jgi:hypothetical protein
LALNSATPKIPVALCISHASYDALEELLALLEDVRAALFVSRVLRRTR